MDLWKTTKDGKKTTFPFAVCKQESEQEGDLLQPTFLREKVKIIYIKNKIIYQDYIL